MKIWIVEHDNDDFRDEPEVKYTGESALESVRTAYEKAKESEGVAENSDDGFCQNGYECEWNFNGYEGSASISDTHGTFYSWRITSHEIAPEHSDQEYFCIEVWSREDIEQCMEDKGIPVTEETYALAYKEVCGLFDDLSGRNLKLESAMENVRIACFRKDFENMLKRKHYETDYDALTIYLDSFEVGSCGFVKCKDYDLLAPVKLVHVIRRSEDPEKYDNASLEHFQESIKVYFDYTGEIVTDDEIYYVFTKLV